MISHELRARVGYDPEELFRRSQAAYSRAYEGGEVPSWSKHPLPDLTQEFARGLFKMSERPVVLDSGCGDGNKTEKLAGLGLQVIGVDFEEAAISQALIRQPISGVQAEMRFVQGDVRRLNTLFPANTFDGIFDYQCLASIPPDFWRDVQEEYYAILKPGGLLFIDLLNLEGPEFHGDIADKLKNSHEYAFGYDPDNPTHSANNLNWEDGLYVYFLDGHEAESIFGERFKLEVLQKRIHPYNERRILWTALLKTRKK